MDWRGALQESHRGRHHLLARRKSHLLLNTNSSSTSKNSDNNSEPLTPSPMKAQLSSSSSSSSSYFARGGMSTTADLDQAPHLATTEDGRVSAVQQPTETGEGRGANHDGDDLLSSAPAQLIHQDRAQQERIALVVAVAADDTEGATTHKRRPSEIYDIHIAEQQAARRVAEDELRRLSGNSYYESVDEGGLVVGQSQQQQQRQQQRQQQPAEGGTSSGARYRQKSTSWQKSTSCTELLFGTAAVIKQTPTHSRFHQHPPHATVPLPPPPPTTATTTLSSNGSLHHLRTMSQIEEKEREETPKGGDGAFVLPLYTKRSVETKQGGETET
jgi:hypothetical protein